MIPSGRLRKVRRRFTDVPFAVALAYVGINSAISYFVAPARQPAHLLPSPLDYLWVAMYGAGGLLILTGIGTARSNLEAAGCFGFGGGAAVSAVANGVVNGLHDSWNTVLTLALFTGAALVRAHHLSRGRVLVLLDTGGTYGLGVHSDDHPVGG